MFLVSKLKTYLAMAGAVVIALAVAFLKGRASGKSSAHIDGLKKQEKLQDDYDEIDRQPIDFDESVDRLRDRSDR